MIEQCSEQCVGQCSEQCVGHMRQSVLSMIHVRTYGRTNGESFVTLRENLAFRNAREQAAKISANVGETR